MIGRHPDVRGAALQHPDDRRHDPAHRPQLRGRGPIERGRRREKVAEQLERPVDEVHDHERHDTASAGSLEETFGSLAW
jgi:hypothetical protein